MTIKWKLSKENSRREKENIREIEPHAAEAEALDERDLVLHPGRDPTLLRSLGQDPLLAAQPGLLGQGPEHLCPVAQGPGPTRIRDRDPGLKLVLTLDLVHGPEQSPRDLGLAPEQSPGSGEGSTPEKESVPLAREVDRVPLLPKTTDHLIEM